jgi:hypothetical protein
VRESCQGSNVYGFRHKMASLRGRGGPHGAPRQDQNCHRDPCQGRNWVMNTLIVTRRWVDWIDRWADRPALGMVRRDDDTRHELGRAGKRVTMWLTDAGERHCATSNDGAVLVGAEVED